MRSEVLGLKVSVSASGVMPMVFIVKRPLFAISGLFTFITALGAYACFVKGVSNLVYGKMSLVTANGSVPVILCVDSEIGFILIVGTSAAAGVTSAAGSINVRRKSLLKNVSYVTAGSVVPMEIIVR